MPLSQPTAIAINDSTTLVPIISPPLLASTWLPTTTHTTLTALPTKPGEGTILYGAAWQPELIELMKVSEESKLTVHVTSSQYKVYQVQAIFSVSAKSGDHTELAKEADALLIYALTGERDGEKLVLLAREQPIAVSSL